MAALLLRLNKAAPLTNAEVDNNFLYLESTIAGVQNSKLSVSNLLHQIKLIDGQYSGIDADLLHNMLPTDQLVNNSIVSRDSSGNFSANIITATLLGHASTATSATYFTGIQSIENGGTGVNVLNAGHISSDGTKFTSSSTIPGSNISGNIIGLAYGVSGIVPISNGGTGATTISDAKTVLGLIPGQTIQPYSVNLDNLSGISSTGFIVRSGTFQTRNIEVGNCLQITNSDGVSGNPRIDITVVTVANGGTGANTGPAACASIGAAALVSPALTGIPTSPTAAFGTKTAQIATTEFVHMSIVPTGTILTMANIAPPQGFVLTDGAVYSNLSLPDLYAVIGTRFGTGGPGTFFVPHITLAAGFISVIKT